VPALGHGLSCVDDEVGDDLLDLTIPGGPGGKEVIHDLLALDPHVHAIVSSGYADDPVMANPSAYGFKGTVAKPYTARALREAVARVLA
jgi:DNA-binding NarL/FixJ family response regulator